MKKAASDGGPPKAKRPPSLRIDVTQKDEDEKKPLIPAAEEVTPKDGSLEETVSFSKFPVINLNELMKDDNGPYGMALERKQLAQKSMSTVAAKEKIVVNQEEFDKRYGYRRINLSLGRRFVYHFKMVGKWKTNEWLNFMRWRMPILRWLPSYSIRNDLQADIVGGLMVSIMCVPQGLAYGYLVGVPPIYGLFSGIVGPLIYAFFGSSRHTSPGTFAIVALMVGSVVQDISISAAAESMTQRNETFLATTTVASSTPAVAGDLDNICCAIQGVTIDPQQAVDIATAVTLLVGIFQLIFGLLNAGLLAVWLSDHLVKGLTSGAAIHVLTSQVKAMTGIRNVPSTSEPFGLIKFYMCFFSQLHNIHLNVLITSLLCVVLLLFSSYVVDPAIKKWVKAKFPMEFFLVIFSTLITGLSKGTNLDVALPAVGKVESGMVPPRVPPMEGILDMMGPSITIAIISFVIHIALAKLVSKKLNYEIDANQEWFALGAMHTISAFFGCFAGGSSLGRTMTHVKFDTKSQIATIVCVVVLVLVVFWAAPLIEFLPKSVLACIVVVAMKDLFIQIFEAQKLLRESVVDYLIFVVTFTSVILLNVHLGLVSGVCFALLTVVFRTQWAESTCMGRIPGTFDFKGLGHYSTAEEVPGVKVFRFDAPLYFANAETFIERVHEASGLNPLLVKAKLSEQKEREAAEAKKSAEKRDEKKQKEKKVEDGSTTTNPSSDPPEIQLLVKNKDVKVDHESKENAEDGESEIVQLTHIIIDCSTIPYVDLMGKDALAQTFLDYGAIDITVMFANCKVYVRQFFERCDFYQKVPKTRMFVSISDAVAQAQKEQSLPFIERQGAKMIHDDKPPVPVAKSPRMDRSKMEQAMRNVTKTAREKESVAETQPEDGGRLLERTASQGEITATDRSPSARGKPRGTKRPTTRYGTKRPRKESISSSHPNPSQVNATQEYFADEDPTQHEK